MEQLYHFLYYAYNTRTLVTTLGSALHANVQQMCPTFIKLRLFQSVAAT
jgi:hypothetical protein